MTGTPSPPTSTRLLTQLDLRDATVVGLSLGTGELARYIGTRGTERLGSCVFIESLAAVIRQVRRQPPRRRRRRRRCVSARHPDDRFAWLTGLISDFLNLEDYQGTRVSEGTVRAMWNAGADAGAVRDLGLPAWLAGRFQPATSPTSTYRR